MKRLGMGIILVGMAMSLSACGGFSEDDAIQNVRDHAETDYFGNMSDPELIHAMHENCSTIEDDGLEGLSSEWVGLMFLTDADPMEARSDYILTTANAVKAYCPEYQDDFDNYRDGEWADALTEMENN